MARSKGYLLHLLLSAFAVMALFACASVPQADSKNLSPSPQPSTVLVFDEWISNVVTIQSQTAESYDGLFVTRTTFNLDMPQPLHLKAQTFFKNAQGQTIDSSPIREITLMPRTPLVYAAHSPQTGIKNFVVYLRAVQEIKPSSVTMPPLLLDLR